MGMHMKTENKGFTLIELLVVMAIIGILASVAVTSYIGSGLKAARSEAYANLEALRLLEETLFAETAAYAAAAGVCAANNPGNVALIQAQLPGFQPAPAGNFSYCIELNVDIAGAAQANCFRAQAFGNTTGRAPGDVFAIDCNNNRTF